MKKKLLVFAALLALSASSAWASGVNLGWNNCPTGTLPAPGYTTLRTFACNTNVGTNTLVGSFVAPAGVVGMSANEVVMDVQTGGLALAPWWGMASGQCRAAASVAGNFDFTGFINAGDCYDYWQAGAIGALSWSVLPNTTNRCRIKGVFALPAGDARITSIPVGLEVYSYKCNINNAKSTGLGACAGCSDEACIVLNSIRINQPVASGGSPIFMANPVVGQHAIWQAWTSPDINQACPLVTPTKKQTWGSIKALYR